MQPAAGQLIAGRFRLTDRIGAGGMGVVYGAEDEQLHRPVAIKFLPAALTDDADRLSRFRNEARALSALNHPHIITIYEVGIGETPFIAMERVHGETLRARLQSGGLPLGDAIEIALQVARALSAAHDRGLVHRDIKPENVMIRPDGYVKVLDFGLAELRPPSETGEWAVAPGDFETVARSAAGTPAYMSPEQIAGEPVDPRSDIFALGVLICEAIAGENPFARSTLVETTSAIVQTPVSAVPVTTRLPPSVKSIVVRALQKSPAERYQRLTDLIADLQQVLTRLTSTASGVRTRYVAAAVLALIAVGSASGIAYQRSQRRHWVREQALPQIAKLAKDERAASAFRLIETAERYLPGDPGLQAAIASATRVATIHSSPAGAIVEVKDYLAPGEAWLPLGTTPLEKVRIPTGYLRWKVSKAGVGESVTAPFPLPLLNFDLQQSASAPAGMVPVDGGITNDYFAFLGAIGPYDLPPFFIDKFEVTNREYQKFVDAGGYAKREYWTQPFVENGRELSWADAMSLLRDPTGRPGPATWEGGHYPDGKGDYPVSGVSWYEAAAYAEFAGKSLPVLAQALKVAPNPLDKYVLALSNGSSTLAPVGRFDGLGPYGTYDLVGNVREWYFNQTSDHRRFTLGRLANSYGPEALPPFDRSPLNGLRCVRNSASPPAGALAPHALYARDVSKAKPAGDEVFRLYQNMFAYDKGPLDATVQAVGGSTPDWTTQKITFNAAYGGERVPAFLFLPAHATPPFQTVLFFPSARVNGLPSSDALGDMSFVDYVIKSGRAVMYPVYKQLYERHSTVADTYFGPMLNREIVIDWSKDIGRSIDYLSTRSDIDPTRLAYLGVSQGAADGVIFAAIEQRFKAIVLLDGGLFSQEHPVPGMDQVDFAPRVTRPVLMVNGRYDATFPLETAQIPLFKLLGAPAANKRHVQFDTPHDVTLRRDDLLKEVLAWFDTYLGPIH
jgi:formylglycine-generating enzyme required for sulfatase activity